MRTALLLLVACLPAMAGTRTMFGITVQWEAETKALDTNIGNALETIASEGRDYYDPDCRWRQRANGSCPNRFPEKTQELERLAAIFKTETLGYYDIRHTGNVRDFGGLWQGHALEALHARFPGKWLVDISGDILATDTQNLQKPITITDPVFDTVTYAKIEMNAGYAVASVGRRLAGTVRVPENVRETERPREIMKVVLFASPRFSGTRIDAWSTAVIAGGDRVLNHLWSLAEYSGQWGYFYFESNGTPHCSPNLACQLTGDDRRVRVPF